MHISQSLGLYTSYDDAMGKGKRVTNIFRNVELKAKDQELNSFNVFIKYSSQTNTTQIHKHIPL